MTEMITYCGLYCGACPSYQKSTCLGCRSEDRKQNRKSKWGCKIRICCHEEKNLNHCGQCENTYNNSQFYATKLLVWSIRLL